MIEVAERLEADGLDQLWVIEDCFYTVAPSLAAAALARADRLQVGLGILPAVARNAAVTAMEIATLERLAPGRVIAGIGHGVQTWMEQSMPAEWWAELGAIGNLDDVAVHVAGLHDAGAADVAFFPGPSIEMTREDLDAVAAIRASLGDRRRSLAG